jgi:hypothetical protein
MAGGESELALALQLTPAGAGAAGPARPHRGQEAWMEVFRITVQRKAIEPTAARGAAGFGQAGPGARAAGQEGWRGAG